MNLFRTTLLALISLASSAYAGNWTSPTEGQTLHVNQPFTFSWQASHPYPTTPRSVMVLLSLGTFSSAKAGTTLAYELTPTSSSTGTYTATLTPILAYDSPTGSYQLVVVESYNGYLNVPQFSIDTLSVVVGA